MSTTQATVEIEIQSAPSAMGIQAVFVGAAGLTESELETIVRANRERLAQNVIKTINTVSGNLDKLRIYILELWKEFENLSSGETIFGCSTKKEFCEKQLHRTPRAIRYLLDGGNHCRTEYVRGETVSPEDHILTNNINFTRRKDVMASNEIIDEADKMLSLRAARANAARAKEVDIAQDAGDLSCASTEPVVTPSEIEDEIEDDADESKQEPQVIELKAGMQLKVGDDIYEIVESDNNDEGYDHYTKNRSDNRFHLILIVRQQSTTPRFTVKEYESRWYVMDDGSTACGFGEPAFKTEKGARQKCEKLNRRFPPLSRPPAEFKNGADT